MREKMKHWWQLLVYLFHRFYDGGCTYRAAALTFTTLLAIVPLIAVSFAILSAFPAFNTFGMRVQDFIISNFVATSGKAIQGYIQEFVQHVSQLSVLSVAFLIVTAILMMYTIEESFNEIWKVKRERHVGSSLLLYWGVLTISPILMSVGLFISSYLIALPQVNTTVEHLGLKDLVLPLISFLLSSTLFTILYLVVPNCLVRFRYGLIGGLIAGLLFEISKAGFTIYLYFFPTYQLLYGTLAAIPLFFLWVYISWLIILFGGVVAHSLAFRHKLKSKVKLDGFTHAIHWLGYFWKAQLNGKSLSLDELISKDSYGYQVEPEDQLECLIEKKIIQPTDDGKYVLNRDLSTFTLGEFYSNLPWQLPATDKIKSYQIQEEDLLEKKLEIAEKTLYDHLNIPLIQIFKSEEPPIT
jgi:membrane protein